MPDCGSCGAGIEFVPIVTSKGARKHHPINVPRRKVPQGRVVYDDSISMWRILDARLKRGPDGSWETRAGIDWPVDGGAYESHFDTCPEVYRRRVADRTYQARTEEELAAALLEDANAHIPRCSVCGWPMDEGLAADDRVGGRRRPWRTHPSCDPEHRRATVDEANRLTGRRDVRASTIAVPAALVVEAQHEHIRRLADDERRNRPDWRQGVLTGEAP